MRPFGGARARRSTAAALLALALAGGPPPAPASVPAGDDPLAVTEEIVAFVEERIRRDQTRQARLLALREAIFDPDDGLGVEYGSSLTRSAAETFRQRSGNCLSFTLLFVVMARELDLDAYFVEVDEVTGWSQRGNVGFSHWHMYAEVEIDNGIVPVDFLPWSDREYRSRRRIDEARVRAHYFSNLGAEALVAGDGATARALLQRALEADTGFHPARVNLAVALRRHGDVERAEALLLDVLARDTGNVVAAANLAALYLAEGRDDDARQWLARRDAFLRANPFHHFRQGMRALQEGAAREAVSHFRQAIRRQPDEAAFFEQLAAAHVDLGRARRARAALRQALRLADDEERRRRIERRLAMLDGSGEPAPEGGSPTSDG